MSDYYQLLDCIRKEKHVIRAEILTNEMKKDLLEIEMKKLKDEIPLINKGLDQSFKEKEAIVLLFETKYLSNELKPKKTLRNKSGKIIEENMHDNNKLKLFPNYEDKFFLISDASPKYVTEKPIEKLVQSITIALVSSDSNQYIKKCFEIDDNLDTTTIIIGFTRE